MLRKAALLFVTFALPAQGFVNASLLKAPADDPASKAHAGIGAKVVTKARSAVVYVVIEVEAATGKFAIERASSGVVIDPSGLVLTWQHLVREADAADDKTLFVQLNDAANTRLPAMIERVDATTGLALLRVSPPAPLPFLELGDDMPRPGDFALALARPEGKEMVAFAGVASPALAGVAIAERKFAANEVFLTDSRSDLRCDGAPVLDADGRVMGLYATANVLRDRSEPTLEDLQRPSFGVVLPAAAVRRVFQKEFAAAKNPSLKKAGAPSASPGVEAVAKVAPSVVSVWAGDGEWPALGSTDPGAVQRRAGLGSGVVLGKKGLVVTNAHLVKSGAARVRTSDGRTFPAKVVKTHGGTNLALLQVELPSGQSLPAADCNPDDDTILGEMVYAIGNPIGTQPVVTAGVVSARRDREGGRIQADANLGNANAGGAVVDAVGRVLGIGDGGAVDPLEQAYQQRGDKVTTETNLSTFVGIGRLRKVFQSQIEAATDATESIRSPAAVSPTDQQKRASALTAMVQKTSSALLNVYVSRNVAKVSEDDPFASMVKPELVTLGLGSGVIIDRSGLAISNWHVVDDAVNPDGSMRSDHAVSVRVFGGKEYPVKVLSISREDDLSLLQLQLAPGEEVTAVELGNSDALGVGDAVAAIGNPHGRANTITYGVVVAKDQGINIKGRWAKMNNLIETDAAINGGNSGGALLDMNGRLVGINSAGGGTFTNRGYAIAVDHVRTQVLGLLFAAYKLRSPELGIRVVDEAGKVVVSEVDERGPAAKAGVQKGDVVVSLNGVAITWSPGFAMTLLQQTANTAIPLEVERAGKKSAIQVAPIAPEVWAVIRQSGLACRDLPFAEGGDRIRLGAIAIHRQITGDPTAEPQQIPESAIVVDRLHSTTSTEFGDVAPGDLLFAIELSRSSDGQPVYMRVATLAALRDLWNDRQLGAYEQQGGRMWKCWFTRGDKARAVDVRASRLFW